MTRDSLIVLAIALACLVGLLALASGCSPSVPVGPNTITVVAQPGAVPVTVQSVPVTLNLTVPIYFNGKLLGKYETTLTIPASQPAN